MLSARLGSSHASSPSAAAAELAATLDQPGAAFHLAFASPRYNPEALAVELARALPGAPVIGCTTAGELSPKGFTQGSLVGLSLASSELRQATAIVRPLETASFADIRDAARRALAQVDGESAPSGELYGMLLIDGLSQREESFAAAVAAAAPQVRWVGGSAADLEFRAAHIFYEGHAIRDAALMLILRTTLPIVVIKSDHMRPTGKKTVVTAASPDGRRVMELDGRPALERYAQLLDVPPTAVTRELAGSRPFACRVAGVSYVRSVSGIEPGALRFACAVATGTVLELMEPGDLVGETRIALAEARKAAGGELAAVVAFNCLGRFLEAEQRGLVTRLGETYASHPVVGFNTYGEQCDGLHVNHTFTGLAFGRGR